MKQLIRYLLTPLCCFAIGNAFAQKEAVVTGSFDGAAENEIVYISSSYGATDSAYISNKRYKFSLPADSSWDAYFIKWVSKTYYTFPLFLRQGSRINFEVNKKLDGFKISGDKSAEEQQAFYQGLFAANKSSTNTIRKKIAATKDSTALIDLKKQLEDAAESSQSSYVTNWLLKHKNSPFSVMALRYYLYKGSKEDTLAQKYFDLLTAKAKKNNYQAEILLSEFANFNQKYSTVAVNSLAPNFSIRDTSNNVIELSQFKNKYLLIDFWASWCGPCRANNPFLKSIYERYKDKGLEVLSISIDADTSHWKAAIQKDGLNWLQGSDILGSGSKASRKYQVTGVPTYVLIGPDGRVLMKSLGGDFFDKLDSKLKESLL